MPARKGTAKNSSKKRTKPTISNTGFLGAVYVDKVTLSNTTKYFFARKKLKITHHVMEGLMQVISNIFVENHIQAHISCVYLAEEEKLGFVLSKSPFIRQVEDKSYFINYLREMGHLRFDHNKEQEHEIFSTGFIGCVFADLRAFGNKFTYNIEINIIENLVRGIMIPIKELFIEHGSPCYISGVEIEEGAQLGFVLSKKAFDEREAPLYFENYLTEIGVLKEEEPDEMQIRDLKKELL